MKVNPSHETIASLLSSAISRDKFSTDFQANLDLAKERQQKQSSKTPDAAAMEDAMATALKELQDYIEKGPIAHMRERILEKMGLSEEDLAKMPPEQRDAVEKTIAAKIKEWLLSGSGIDTKSMQAQLASLQMQMTQLRNGQKQPL
jgi:TPP-dependent pyruvate/acetoin dehydrogenase alpha subunit